MSDKKTVPQTNTTSNDKKSSQIPNRPPQVRNKPFQMRNRISYKKDVVEKMPPASWTAPPLQHPSTADTRIAGGGIPNKEKFEKKTFLEY